MQASKSFLLCSQAWTKSRRASSILPSDSAFMPFTHSLTIGLSGSIDTAFLQQVRIWPCQLSEVVDDFAGGVGAGCTSQTVAGMRAGTTEIKSADRRFIASPIEDRAHREKLIEGELAMENVAAGETVDGLKILRSDDLYVF